MTPTAFATHVRYRTNTNSTTFTDAEIIALMNVHIDALSARILAVDQDYFGSPQTTDLIATSGTFANREYPLPSDMLNRIKLVEAKLDNSNWFKLIPFDLSQHNRPATETTVLQDFANEDGYAVYDIFRNSLWIYSGAITASTGGLKIWTFTWPAHITSLVSSTDMSVDPSTTTHGFPRILHPILADLVIIDYKQSKEKPIPLTENEASVEFRTQIALESLKKVNKDEEVLGGIPDEISRWNSGYDL